jgi:hypothetical protein
MFFCVTSAISQEIKPLLIGGAGQMYNNKYDKGHYYYGYLDYKPIQIGMSNTALGVYAKYNYWRGIYEGQEMERINNYGAGISFGFIPNYFLSYDIYSNISLGYRESKHHSWTRTDELPDRHQKFIDISMYTHLMDEYSMFFFRHKLFIDMSYNTDSNFTNEYFQIKLDESIYNFYVGELNLAPKIILGYTSNTWYNFYEIGLGVDLFSKWFINIVDLSLIYKYDPRVERKNYIELSAGVDIFNLFNN